MAYVPNSGSVVAFQSDPTKLVGTFSVVGILPVTQSGAQVHSVMGMTSIGGVPTDHPVRIGGVSHASTPSAVGNNTVNNLWLGTLGQLMSANVSANGANGNDNNGMAQLLAPTGFVTIPYGAAGHVYNGANWDRARGNSSIGALVSTGASSVIIAGVINAAGSVVAFQGGAPWANTNVGSVITIQIGSVITVLKDSSILAGQIGTRVTSLVSTVPSSVIVGASIFGQLPAGTAPLGSVAVLQGTNPWATTNVGSIITVFKDSSILAGQIGTVVTSLVSTVPSSVIVGASIFGQLPAGTAPIGSVATLQGTNPWITLIQANSIVGTYLEDAAHATGDRGLLTLNVRNDTLSSITSADSDYSAHAMGPAGETIVAIAPFTKGIQGTGDLRVVLGSSVVVIAAQGASIFSYIRTAQIANVSPNSVLLTFGGGLGSILSYTIAPGGGGSNIKFDPWIKTGENSAFTASISGTASVLVSAQGFIAKI